MKVVAVTFFDSSTMGEWAKAEAYQKRVGEVDLACEAVGFMPFEFEDRVVLFQSRTADNASLSDPIVIPKGAITDIKVVRA